MKSKSRLQSILRFSIISVVFLVVYASALYLIDPDIAEIKDIFTTGIALIGSMTIALIGRYGARETVLSSKADNPEVAEMITKGMNNER